MREVAELALDQSALTVALNAKGEEGLELARRTRRDLVFLDLRMPGIDGLETLRRLLAVHADLRVQTMTAFHEELFPLLRGASAEGLPFELSRKPLEMDQIRKLAALAEHPDAMFVD